MARFFINIGENPPRAKAPIWINRRNWDACVEYGFFSAGQGLQYSNPLYNLQIGDIVYAYISSKGYVGVGKVLETATPIKNFRFNGIGLNNLFINNDILNGVDQFNIEFVDEIPLLKRSIFQNANNIKTEVVVGINWIKTVKREVAHWRPGLFATPHTCCTLENQQETIQFLNTMFAINI